MDYGTNEDRFNLSSNIHRSSSDDRISNLTDLSLDMMHEIFDYLALGDIYLSFYQLNNLLKTFIDNCYPCLNINSMSYGQSIFYFEKIFLNNPEHSQKISSLIISNEKPFNRIEKFFPIFNLYTNLKQLHLYSPNINQLEILSLSVPNLCELYIILQNEKVTNIKWLSSFKKLEICSIDSKICGIEIDQSLRSLSSSLSSLTITLSSTYDFYTILPRLPTDTLVSLNISLFDDQFSYTKTFHSPISLAKNLVDFSFNMSLKEMKDASCLYDIIRFLTSTLRHVNTLTILCRFADGIFIDEEKLRNYLSFAYSIRKYKLFIEMNNLPKLTLDQSNFDEKTFACPFWIDKGVHVNIYRNQDDQIKRVRIYTLPLVSQISNLPNHLDDTYKLIKSILSNIHQFISDDLHASFYSFADDRTLTPNRIYSSSNISLLSHLPRLLSFGVTKDEMFSFFEIFSQNRSFPNIRKLQLGHFPALLMRNTQQIFNIFPCLQSLSVDKVDDFSIFGDILDKFLPDKQVLIHLRVGGFYFDDICPEYLNEKLLKTNLEEIFIPLYKRKNSYDISFDRYTRFIDIWL